MHRGHGEEGARLRWSHGGVPIVTDPVLLMSGYQVSWASGRVRPLRHVFDASLFLRGATAPARGASDDGCPRHGKRELWSRGFRRVVPGNLAARTPRPRFAESSLPG